MSEDWSVVAVTTESTAAVSDDDITVSTTQTDRQTHNSRSTHRHTVKQTHTHRWNKTYRLRHENRHRVDTMRYSVKCRRF